MALCGKKHLKELARAMDRHLMINQPAIYKISMQEMVSNWFLRKWRESSESIIIFWFGTLRSIISQWFPNRIRCYFQFNLALPLIQSLSNGSAPQIPQGTHGQASRPMILSIHTSRQSHVFIVTVLCNLSSFNIILYYYYNFCNSM